MMARDMETSPERFSEIEFSQKPQNYTYLSIPYHLNITCQAQYRKVQLESFVCIYFLSTICSRQKSMSHPFLTYIGLMTMWRLCDIKLSYHQLVLAVQIAGLFELQYLVCSRIQVRQGYKQQIVLHNVQPCRNDEFESLSGLHEHFPVDRPDSSHRTVTCKQSDILRPKSYMYRKSKVRDKSVIWLYTSLRNAHALS